jgi:type IV pilus assembly protein PilA
MAVTRLKKILGFTLLEMMLVIAMIGILASVAIPAYQDYLIRARVSECISLSMPAKLAVNEYYMSFNALPSNPQVLNFHAPEPTDNISEITISQNGVIAVHYTERAGQGSLILTPSVKSEGRIVWCCDGGTLPEKYRPNICKCH